MNRNKVEEALKEIFDRYGKEIIRDRHRFHSALSDLLDPKKYPDERIVFQYALASSALEFILTEPPITCELQQKAMDRLKKECRMMPEDSKFVVECLAVTCRNDFQATVVQKQTVTRMDMPVEQIQKPVPRLTDEECFQKGLDAADREDFWEAVQWYRQAAEMGHPAAQNRLGLCYGKGRGVPVKDPETAVKWFRKSAEQGYAAAQYNLGYAYAQGEGMLQDWKQAVSWFRKAAGQGNKNAQYWLGACYENGFGISCDIKTAILWYQKAATEGYADADIAWKRLQNMDSIQSVSDQLSADDYFCKGVQAEQNNQFEEAVNWYRKAADLGHAVAQNNLGTSFYAGKGVPQDYLQAVHWFFKAANQGQVHAQYNLGVCYENGYGVPYNQDYAMQFYQQAAEQGHPNAPDGLKRLQIDRRIDLFLNAKGKFQTGKSIIDFLPDKKSMEKRLSKARKYYLDQLGYTDEEEILIFFDNTVTSGGKKGFVLTNRGFYSSNKSFFIFDYEVTTIQNSGSDLLINNQVCDVCLLKKEIPLLVDLLKVYFNI